MGFMTTREIQFLMQTKKIKIMEKIGEELTKIKLPLSKHDYKKLKEIAFSNETATKDIPIELLAALSEVYDKGYSGEFVRYD